MSFHEIRISKGYPLTAIPTPYLLLVLAHITLIWALPWFPTQDGPSHVYNVFILKDLLEGGATWGKYYEEHLSFVPNLGFALIALPLMKVVGPLVAERLFLSIYVLLLTACVPVFNRSLSVRPWPASYLVFPLLFNFTLLMGFYSYVIAIPLFFLALAMSWRLREANWWLRLLCQNAAALVIFICHFIPFVFYLIALCLIPFAISGKESARPARRLFSLLTITPSLFLCAWYLAQGKGGLLSNYNLLRAIGRVPGLMVKLLAFSTISFPPVQILTTALLMAFVLFTLRSRLRQKNAPLDDGERFAATLAGLLCVIYLLAPYRLGEGSFFNERFPWVLLLLITPLLQTTSAAAQRYLVFLSCTSLLVTGFAMATESRKVEMFMSALNTNTLQPGNYIMTYMRHEGKRPKVNVLRHAVSHYGTLRGCIDLGNYEAGLPYFFIRKKPLLAELPSADDIEYKPWEIDPARSAAIDRILFWGKKDTKPSPLLHAYTEMYSFGELTIMGKK